MQRNELKAKSNLKQRVSGVNCRPAYKTDPPRKLTPLTNFFFHLVHNSMGDNDIEGRQAHHVVTAHQILEFGLMLLHSGKRIQRAKKGETNNVRFNLKYGLKPMSAATLYEDMQVTDIDSARIEKADAKTLKFFLITLYFLRKHPVMDVIESTFDYSPGCIGNVI